MKKILGIVAVVAFMAVSLGVGSIYAQEKDKKSVITVEDEIAQKHKKFIQKINLSKQENVIKEKAQASADALVQKKHKEQLYPDPQPGTQYAKPEGLPGKVIVYNPDGTINDYYNIFGKTLLGDVDGNRILDYRDLDIVMQSSGSRRGNSGYNEKADISGDGMITVKDVGLERNAILKGNDVNGDGKIDDSDLEVVKSRSGLVVGNPLYNENADLNHDGRITVADVGLLRNFVNEYYKRAGKALQALDEKDVRAPLIEYEDGKVASLTIFGSDGKPAYRHAYGADGKIKYTVNYDKDAGSGDEFVLKAPLIEYKDGNIASLTIFAADGKSSDKYTFDEDGRIIEKIQYGTGNDINGDGKIDKLDIEAVRSHTGAVIGNPLYNENADLNHDGRITGTDVVLLRNAIDEKNLRMPAKEPYEGDSPGKKPVIAEPDEKILENISVVGKPAYVKPEPSVKKPGAAGYYDKDGLIEPTPYDNGGLLVNEDGLKPIYAAKGTAVYDKLINAGYKPAAHVSVNSGGSYEMFFVPQYEDFAVPSIPEKPKILDPKKPTPEAPITVAPKLPVKEPIKSPLISLPVRDKVGGSVSAMISVVSEVNEKMDVLEAAKTDLPPGVSMSSQVVTKKDAEQPMMGGSQ